MQQKRADLLKQELEEKMREEENKDRIKNEETEKIQEEDAVLAEEEEKRKKQREVRLKKREEKRGDSWISGDDEVAVSDSELNTEIKAEDFKKESPDEIVSNNLTTTNTTITTDGLSDIESQMKQEIKDEVDIKCSDKKPGDSLLALTNKVKLHLKIRYLSFNCIIFKLCFHLLYAFIVYSMF